VYILLHYINCNPLLPCYLNIKIILGKGLVDTSKALLQTPYHFFPLKLGKVKDITISSSYSFLKYVFVCRANFIFVLFSHYFISIAVTRILIASSNHFFSDKY